VTSIDKIRTTVGEYTGEEFVSNLSNICQDITNNLDILTFGMIVYDETTPEYRKLLRDKDYWEALDKSSGDKMIIFSLIDGVDREVSHTIEFMVAGRSSNQDKGKSYSKLMKAVFDDESLLVYPSVLFFQVADGEVYDYRLVPLRRKSPFESTQAIQELFESISAILNNILPEYYGNRREIFNLVKEELLNQKYTMYILQGPRKLSDFIGIVKNIFWI